MESYFSWTFACEKALCKISTTFSEKRPKAAMCHLFKAQYLNISTYSKCAFCQICNTR